MEEHRQRLARLMDLLVRNREKIHYRQARPMATRKIVNELMLRTILAGPGLSMDCSESVTLLCRLAGLADPNGRHYDGSGFTGTLLSHLGEHGYVEPKAANVGALVVFGGGSGEHVCMVRHPGSDPLLFSHGQESGPFFLNLTAEDAVHAGPTVFLPITALIP